MSRRMCAFYTRFIAIIIIIHLSHGLTCVDKTALEKKMHREQEYGFVSINLRVLEKGPRYYFIKQSGFHGFHFFAFATLVSYAHLLSVHHIYRNDSLISE